MHIKWMYTITYPFSCQTYHFWRQNCTCFMQFVFRFRLMSDCHLLPSRNFNYIGKQTMLCPHYSVLYLWLSKQRVLRNGMIKFKVFLGQTCSFHEMLFIWRKSPEKLRWLMQVLLFFCLSVYFGRCHIVSFMPDRESSHVGLVLAVLPVFHSSDIV